MGEASCCEEHAIKADLMGLMIDLILIARACWNFNNDIEDHG
jgi:hypothetical protein